jgi:hypothetical protein
LFVGFQRCNIEFFIVIMSGRRVKRGAAGKEAGGGKAGGGGQDGDEGKEGRGRGRGKPKADLTKKTKTLGTRGGKRTDTEEAIVEPPPETQEEDGGPGGPGGPGTPHGSGSESEAPSEAPSESKGTKPKAGKDRKKRGVPITTHAAFNTLALKEDFITWWQSSEALYDRRKLDYASLDYRQAEYAAQAVAMTKKLNLVTPVTSEYLYLLL